MGLHPVPDRRAPGAAAVQPGKDPRAVQGLPSELEVEVQGGHPRGCLGPFRGMKRGLHARGVLFRGSSRMPYKIVCFSE